MACMQRREMYLHAWLFMLCLPMDLSVCTFVQLNDDVLGLIVFKAELMDPTNALSSWTEDDNSPCNWTAIMCDAPNGRVVKLNLAGLSLSGRMGRGLGKVSYLQNLSVAHNNLSGTIAPDLVQLVMLKEVDLSHNLLSGPLDVNLGNLPSLRSLDLSYNVLNGAIPTGFFSKCKNLHYLSLENNFLEGSVPYTIGSCTGLRTLDLSVNRLTDALPKSMATLLGLQRLDVSSNSISGSLEVTFLPNLVDLRVQNNRFSGNISPGIGRCSLLQHLDVSENFLSSELPASMQNLSFLTSLDTSYNMLFGALPLWVGDLMSLRVLNLSHNAFDGQIPSTIGSLKSLNSLDLSFNMLSGPVPINLSSCFKLKHMDLSFNKISSSIPENLIALGLASLNLAHNMLTGEVPKAFFNQCGSLEALDLSQNQITGALPHITACTKMFYFNVSYNLLSGDINVLSEGSQLVALDLSHNQLSGNIPASIGDASMLSILFLEMNKLNGSIPPGLGNCTSLKDINLSQNNLHGSIPSQLGNLKELEALDLSFNNLSGKLPPELGQDQKLTKLNVSYNQLQGPIPGSGAYVRFNVSTYVGNTGLCGADVNVTCPNVMPKPIVLNPNTSRPHQMVGKNPWTTIEQHGQMLLSASAILAIAAAGFIFGGVVIVLVLNGYAHSELPRAYSDILRSSFSSSSRSDGPGRKLVMFTKNSYPRAEDWITTAHQALLNKDSELGRGGFGTVYKAVLGDGRAVAIKKLTAATMVRSQEDFEKEMQLLARIKHPNLLVLQGYYWTPELQLLIFDFIPNGNLYSMLHEKTPHTDSSPLTWARRFDIVVGVACGLAHLHHSCHPPVTHYNVKSSNILLDEDYTPRIADYGLTKLLPMLDKYLMSSKYQSALGYMAPELVCQSSRINEKSDVYGYGVMVLELVTGRRPVEYREDDVVILCDYVRALVDEGKAMRCIDRRINDYVDDEVLPVIKLGLICTSQVPSNRPSMAEVVQVLELIKDPGSSTRELL